MAVSAGPRAGATPGWVTRCLPFLAHRSWLAPGIPCCLPQPQELLHRTSIGGLFRSGQVEWGQSRTARTPALAQSLGRDRELGDVCACKMDPKQQWGPFSTGASESLSGGGGRAWLLGHPHISLCLAIGSAGVLGLAQLYGSVSQSPWEPEGLSEEGRKCAHS